VTEETERLLAGVARRPPPDRVALERLLAIAGLRLPDEYVAFMESSDGGDGDVGERWLELWPISRVLDDLLGEPHYNDVVLFAGDGANTVYGFDRGRAGEVVEGDWIGLRRDELIRHGTFTEFLRGSATRQD
jgi:hypothetical protein